MKYFITKPRKEWFFVRAEMMTTWKKYLSLPAGTFSKGGGNDDHLVPLVLPCIIGNVAHHEMAPDWINS